MARPARVESRKGVKTSGNAKAAQPGAASKWLRPRRIVVHGGRLAEAIKRRQQGIALRSMASAVGLALRRWPTNDD